LKKHWSSRHGPGLSIGGSIKPVWLAKMKKNAICFALANPVPEVLPKDAKPYVAVMATGGSNYPNQINNALVFPVSSAVLWMLK